MVQSMTLKHVQVAYKWQYCSSRVCNIIMEWLIKVSSLCKLAFVALILCIGISSSSGRAWRKSGENDLNDVKLPPMKVHLSRREAELSFSERLKSGVVRSKSRSQKIDAIVSRAIGRSKSMRLDAETPVHVGDGEFLMKVGVGSPEVSFDAIVDTGSDLIWTQCMPCVDCYNQPSPIFDPSKSSTYSKVPCDTDLCNALQLKSCSPDCTYYYIYGDMSSTSGVLSYETLTIGNGNGTKVPGIGFGCGHDNEGQGFQQGGGLVGLGRGPLSLISQLGSKVDGKFSYCLLSVTDSPSKTSPLFFGHNASFSTGAKTLPLIKSTIIPTFWYIPITGITVDGSSLDIPPGTFDLKSDGSGGMIIDSGTTVTILDEAAYSPLKTAIQSAVQHLTPADGSSTGLDLCYEMPSASAHPNFPSLTFNFQGGVDYDIPTENYFIEIDELLCLAMLGSSGLLASGPSIFGNVQQQNFHILYNDADNTLSFKPTHCDSL